MAFVGTTLAVVVVLWCARLTDNWFSGDTAVPPESPRAQSSANPSPQSVETSKPVAGHDAVLPPTPQRLFLVSTSPGRSIGEGTARIGTDPEHPQTYVAGALLANGAQLTQIHPAYVVLERDGKKVELHIEGGKRNSASELAMLGGPPPVPSTKEITTVDDRLSGVIRSMPVYQGEVLVGLEVYAGRHASVFQQLGLRSGDIIVALDGAPVADASDSLTLLRTLADGAAITATVRRQNTTTTVALDGTVLAATTQPPTTPLSRER